MGRFQHLHHYPFRQKSISVTFARGDPNHIFRNAYPRDPLHLRSISTECQYVGGSAEQMIARCTSIMRLLTAGKPNVKGE